MANLQTQFDQPKPIECEQENRKQRSEANWHREADVRQEDDRASQVEVAQPRIQEKDPPQEFKLVGQDDRMMKAGQVWSSTYDLRGEGRPCDGH